MDVQTRIQNRKRDAIRKTALEELGAELDALRSDLARALKDFEERLDACVAALPESAAVDHDAVDAAFMVEVGTLEDGESIRVGPRAAAVLAALLEDWIEGWVSPDGASPEEGFDEETAAGWADELDDLDDAMSDLERAARKAATRAESELGEMLDDALSALEDEREQAEEELEQQVAGGEVDPGEEAREREAKLWEEQRERAAAIRDAWEPLEELAFEGAEHTVEAVARMRSILETAVDTMLAAYPELRDAARDWVKSDAKRIFKIQPPPKRKKTRDPHSPSFDIDEPRRVTEPLGETRTADYPRDVPPTPAPERKPKRREPPRSWDEAVFRLVRRWEPVRWTEIALVAGPPAAYTLFLVLATLGYRAGLLADNPFHRWGWAFPVFAGFAAYGLVVPLFLEWRVKWRGNRPVVVRWDEHRRDAVLRVGVSACELGELRIPYSTGSAHRSVRDDGDGERLRIVAPSGEELILESGPRSEAWGVTAQTLEQLDARFNR